MATYTELEERIEELKSRTGRMSISPEETFDLMKDMLGKTKGVDYNAASMAILGSYATKADMEADKAPVGTDGKPLKHGQTVSVTSDPVSANNGVYRYLEPGWDLVFRYNDSLIWLKENLSSLKIACFYASVADMQADDSPVNESTGEPLQIGELAAISNPADTGDLDNGKIYAWTGSGWTYMGQLDSITSMDFTDNYFDI
ncbi:hypothetical protein [Limibacterium fermenti]|uniref:hypothetical protein n=1 Tax=Limibacterium fermenti TaxID=3229863 RepID=UPI000E846CE9|nr:hypothetical protein [Porphyromonadaceae bacterium]